LKGLFNPHAKPIAIRSSRGGETCYWREHIHSRKEKTKCTTKIMPLKSKLINSPHTLSHPSAREGQAQPSKKASNLLIDVQRQSQYERIREDMAVAQSAKIHA
jgi:hypothetical protein